MDEDIAEYGALLNCINTCSMWKKSKLMLCVFHAVWKPFNEMIKPRLPKNGRIFTTIGKLNGENIVCGLMHLYMNLHTIFSPYSFPSAVKIVPFFGSRGLIISLKGFHTVNTHKINLEFFHIEHVLIQLNRAPYSAISSSVNPNMLSSTVILP